MFCCLWPSVIESILKDKRPGYILARLYFGVCVATPSADQNLAGRVAYLLTYFGRHSPRRGCANVHSNNHISNCRRPSLAILRRGDSQRQPLLVPPSEAVDDWAAHPSEVLLQLAECLADSEKSLAKIYPGLLFLNMDKRSSILLTLPSWIDSPSPPRQKMLLWAPCKNK